MSIHARLALSVSLVLLVSLLVGAALTYEHVIDKVRTEMQAALSVGAHTAANATDDREEAINPESRLRLVVNDFNGDRHLRAILSAPDGAILEQSTLSAPDDPAPEWFYRLVATASPARVTLDLPAPFRPVGALELEADPHNEVAEAWGDLRLTLTIMAVFFGMVLALVFVTVSGALRPLRDVCRALSGIGEGEYETRIAPMARPELEPLRQGFNQMAARLEEMSAQNRLLHEHALTLQEEERAEIARDLHDEVGPFLFAVDAEATTIRRLVHNGESEAIELRANAISDAVRHMQKHLRGVLRHLAPDALVDLGLAGAIDNQVAFWKSRRPEIRFNVDVTDAAIAPPLDAVVFRIVQESLSNAVRHANPRVVDVSVEVAGDDVIVVVVDDGAGFDPARKRSGFGLAGMKERVRSAGGVMSADSRACGGVRVAATLPIRPDAPAARGMAGVLT